jgi:ribose transport system ATP-binding protein
VSFDLRQGDVVGMTGLAGMGHEDVPYLLVGARRRSSGRILINGIPLGPTLKEALRSHMALVPGDRWRDGIWLAGTATENLTLPVLGTMGSRFRISHKADRRRASMLMSQFDVRPRNPSLQISAFSGGNQQKLLMAKWLQTKPQVIILHAPTQGVDAGGRHEILSIVREAAHAGAGVVICSNDAEELVEVCDRIIIMKDGTCTRTLQQPDLSEATVLEACQAA